MGLFYSSPSKPNFFRIGRGGPSLCGPLKKPRNTALTWFPKLLNRIRTLPQNLALGMKTHMASCGSTVLVVIEGSIYLAIYISIL